MNPENTSYLSWLARMLFLQLLKSGTSMMISEGVLIMRIKRNGVIDEQDAYNDFYLRYLKRIVDVIGALAGLLVLAPVFFLASIWIKAVSPGPVIYKQERIGWKGRPFTMYKFRTMSPDAEDKSGPVWSKPGDKRLIRGGKFFKDTHLDELPQIINVLKGEMTLVGPRPERSIFVKAFREKIPNYDERLKLRPGLTGLAQIRYPYDKSIEDVKRKVESDIEYIRNAQLPLDLEIILKTLVVMATGRYFK